MKIQVEQTSIIAGTVIGTDENFICYIKNNTALEGSHGLRIGYARTL